MNMNYVIKTLIANECITGTIESISTAYAIAIGFIPVSDTEQWRAINTSVPSDKLEKVKTKAWRKYDAIVSPPNDVLGMNWEICEHEWEAKIDSQFSNELIEDVVCKKCGCLGERDTFTSVVAWPTT